MKSIGVLRHFKQREMVLVLINVIIFAVIGIARPTAFLNWLNIKAILSLMSYDLLLAVGITVVLILRGIDLSIGSVLALTSVIMALMMRADMPVVLALFAGLALAVTCGLLNGILIARLQLLPFLVTLGMMSLARGLATVMTSGQYISFPNTAEWFIAFGRAEIPFWKTETMTYGFPVPLLIALIVVSVFGYFLMNWKPLRQMFFVGQNAEAGKLAGLNVVRITVMGYVICALFVWLASVLMISSNRIGYANYGIQSEMRAIAAAVVGGASFFGGSGSIPGTFLGVLMLALIGNGFILLAGDPNWQQATTGLVLILAVAVDAIRTFRERKN